MTPILLISIGNYGLALLGNAPQKLTSIDVNIKSD
jgi:hypothetical protein